MPLSLPEDWLVEKFNLDLSLVARLGGHSQPRTHRGKERFPGMTITYALIQMLEKAWPTSVCTDAMGQTQPFEISVSHSVLLCLT